MENISPNICKNCGSAKFKSWQELNEDEKMIAERLLQENERKEEQIYCSRCLYKVLQQAKII